MHPAIHIFRLMLRAVPDPVHVELVGRLVNHLLQGQGAVRRLKPLEGKRLCLWVTDTGNQWRFRIEGGRLRRDPAGGGWDARIRGGLTDFLLLATRAEDPDTLFFARRLCIEGDTETGLYVKNLLDSMEFDWETHLHAVLGTGRAEALQVMLKGSGLHRPLARLAGTLHRSLTVAAARLGQDAQQGVEAPMNPPPGAV